MVRGTKTPPACMKKYSFPLFCASWASHRISQGEEKEDDNNNENTNKREDYLILGGGGGGGRTGVKNALALARYDVESDVLSESVHLFDTDDDPPYRMAVHPVEEIIICAFSNGCRGFKLNSLGGSAVENVRINPADRSLNQIENMGQQKSIVFSTNGAMFAAGGEDGHLRVFEWSTLNSVLDKREAHKSIKDLDFSPDDTYLASLGDSGPCQIWNLSTCASEATLLVDKGESLGFCRFSRDRAKPLLFMTVKQGDKGLITIWDMKTWKKVGTHAFEKNPISAFNISSDGKFLAIGTSEGDISIIEVSKMHPYRKVKGAHIIFVTSLEFSSDSRLLVSVSGDSSARVSRIEDQKQKAGSLLFLLITIILTIILAFFIGKNRGF
uniref:Uncharacterized protein n=1 Tax=Araucaria cunninghamii TaxID=56994 RepID=A0A0D6R2I9_ARACU